MADALVVAWPAGAQAQGACRRKFTRNRAAAQSAQGLLAPKTIAKIFRTGFTPFKWQIPNIGQISPIEIFV
jgi:hypothetical protein